MQDTFFQLCLEVYVKDLTLVPVKNITEACWAEGPVVPVHSNRMRLNEDGMQAGIALNAAIALRYLSE